MRALMIGACSLEPGVVNGGIESATSTLVPVLAEREAIDSVTVSSATPATTPGSAAPPHRPMSPAAAADTSAARRSPKPYAPCYDATPHGQGVGGFGDLGVADQRTGVGLDDGAGVVHGG